MITMWQVFNFAVAIGAGACIGWHGVLGMPALIFKIGSLGCRLLSWSLGLFVEKAR